ncbi:chemotaxis protein CheW [Chondromyces apiculatus]|nr:chemotaxis protein CheW [Chondromyces apiculatus]
MKQGHTIEQFLTFFVGGEELAINILRIREIVAYRTPTRIPGAAAALRGVINLRGTVVPILDLGIKLGLGEHPVSKNTCVVVVEVILDGHLTGVGVVAESVGQVVELSPGDIEQPPALGMRIQGNAVIGLGKLATSFFPILDVDALLGHGSELHGALGAAFGEEHARGLPPGGGPEEGREATPARPRAPHATPR